MSPPLYVAPGAVGVVRLWDHSEKKILQTGQNEKEKKI
jgi:hypothetical protein